MKNTTKMNPVVHFEMPAKDTKRMSDFYTKTFGWQTQQMGAEYGEYIVVATTETDPKTKMVKTPGTINGGFYKIMPQAKYPSIVISVDDIFEHMKLVQAAGGKIIGGEKLGKPDDIPNIGLYISIEDTEGNRVGMLQPVIPQSQTSNGKS